MNITLTNDQLSTVRYALDQHVMTLTDIMAETGKRVPTTESSRLMETFADYRAKMENLLETLPEV